METLNRTCGWSGCDEVVLEINSRTGKPFYYCVGHMLARKQHKQTYYKNNKNKHNADMLKRYHALRRSVFDMYGSLCGCCGESELAFLALDHVKGGGQKHRKQRGGNYGVYKDALARYDPERFQILCHNCNFAKHQLGECPHQLASVGESNHG